MQLYEEYLRRHGIEDRNITKHTDQAAVFYKSDSDQYWRILWIKWMEPEIHPGHYVVRILRPIHNGGNLFTARSNYLQQDAPHPLFENILRQDKKLFWDEYEDFILGWVKTIRSSDVAVTKTQACIAAWEMLLRCFDKKLAESGCGNLFFATIDPGLGIQRRYAEIKEALIHCERNIPIVHRAWLDKIDFYLVKHCGWLAEMITRNES